MVYVNENLSAEERCWLAQNGATRKALIVVNTTGKPIEGKADLRVGVLDKGHKAFIFLNPPKGGERKERAVVLDKNYGFDVLDANGEVVEPLFQASSVGGYGNSESKFVVLDGTKTWYIRYETYKMRNGYHWQKFTPGEGFKTVKEENLSWVKDEIKEV